MVNILFLSWPFLYGIAVVLLAVLVNRIGFTFVLLMVHLVALAVLLVVRPW